MCAVAARYGHCSVRSPLSTATAGFGQRSVRLPLGTATVGRSLLGTATAGCGHCRVRPLRGAVTVGCGHCGVRPTKKLNALAVIKHENMAESATAGCGQKNALAITFKRTDFETQCKAFTTTKPKPSLNPSSKNSQAIPTTESQTVAGSMSKAKKGKGAKSPTKQNPPTPNPLTARYGHR